MLDITQRKKIVVKVSIVIPVYNAEKYLQQGLASLRDQTLKSIEVLMVNDGSTDSSRAICKSFSDADERFILIDRENGGSAAARKTGMLASCGEYIGFMDADDWCELDMFEKMYQAGAEKKIDIVCCNCYRDFPDRAVACKKQMRDGFYDRKQIEDEILPRTLAGVNAKGETNVIRWANYIRIYRRELIERYNIYNDPRFRRCQDLQLTFEATLHAQSYCYLGDEYLYHNRLVEGSQSRGYTKNQWAKLRILLERLYQDVEGFKEIDLRRQMDLCAFFFAVSTCENESRPCEGLTDAERLDNIKAICDDTLCIGALTGVPVEKLSKVNQAYYFALKARDPALVVKANRKRHRRDKAANIYSRLLSVSLFWKLRDLLRR